MNKYLPLLLLISFFLLFPLGDTQAAIARYGNAHLEHSVLRESHQKAKPAAEKRHGKFGFFKKIKAFKGKWKAKIAQKLAQPLRGNARQYLILFGLLLVAAIVLFAFNRYAAVFNILGSVAMIAAAVFFVLWLLEFTGS